MASTSMTLGSHWEAFIREQVESGRYGSASEVVRDALRQMEEKQSKLEVLREHLAEGLAQARRGDFSSVTAESINSALDAEEDLRRHGKPVSDNPKGN